MTKTMSAQFAGKCRTCKTAFPAGAPIRWTKGAGAECAKCAGITAETPLATARPQTFWCRGAVNQGPHAATGTPARTVVPEVSYRSNRRREDHWCAECWANEQALNAAYRLRTARRFMAEAALGSMYRADPALATAGLDSVAEWDVEETQIIARSFGLGA